MAWIASFLYFTKDAQSETYYEPLTLLDRGYVQASNTLPEPQNAPRTRVVPQGVLCSCVEYAKWFLGKEGTWGYAGNIKPTQTYPTINSLILLPGHVGVVTGITSETVTFTEANYVRCQKSERTLQLDDPSIRGYK